MKSLNKLIAVPLTLAIFAGSTVSFSPPAHAIRMTRKELKLLKLSKRFKKSLFKRGNVKLRILIDKVAKKYKKLKRRKRAGVW